MDILVALVVLLVGAAVLAMLIVKSVIIICPPNKVAIVSGRSRTLADGRRVGYRVIKGGRTLRIPVIEKVSWMVLNTMPIDVSVTNAFSKGAIPLHVQGIANVKVSSSEGLLENAIERFLDREPESIAMIAKETLEANLRGVLATLTPEEVNEDRLKFAGVLIEEADDDMKTLGLELDTLKIQNVTDEVQYLTSIGRKQTALVIRDARIAEASRTAEANEAEATSRQRSEIALANADLRIAEERNDLRVRTAELEAVAAAKEEQASVAGQVARVEAEHRLETARIELEKRRLQADVVIPAQAALQASQLEAQAGAASIIENGKAQVEVFARQVEQYRAAGADAHTLFVLGMLPDIIDKLASTVANIDIDRIAVIDSGGDGGGRGVSNVVNQLPNAVLSMLEQLEASTGIQLMSALKAKQADAGDPSTSTGANALLPPPPVLEMRNDG